MKTLPLALFIFTLMSPHYLYADFYQWTDAAGVLHMTDDADKVPAQYRDKAARIETPDAPRPTPAPSPQAAPRRTPPQKAFEPGGQSERWWRERFGALRAELETLQDTRRQKEQQLVELQRKRTIFQGARDRAAVNAMKGQVAAEEKRIAEVLNKIAALELAAARAGVPAEWLR